MSRSIAAAASVGSAAEVSAASTSPTTARTALSSESVRFTECGTMPCFALKAVWMRRRRSVMRIISLIESVTWSA